MNQPPPTRAEPFPDETGGWGVSPSAPAADPPPRNPTAIPAPRRSSWRFLLACWFAAWPAAGALDPRFTTADPNGGWAVDGYYVHNNMWNAAPYSPCTSTLHARSHSDWCVVTRMNDRTGDGAVKTYPNVHRDYRNVPIRSFESLTSRFAEESPHLGIYNVAYDLWINGIARPGCTEIMIWTENFNQVPGGRYVQDATFGGRDYRVYRAPRSGYLAFVAKTNFTSGTVNLLEIIRWTVGQGWLPSQSTLNQVCFGVEFVSTDDREATFRVTDFSIEAKVRPLPSPTPTLPSGAEAPLAPLDDPP